MALFGKNSKNDTVSDIASKQKRYEALVNAYHTDIYRYAYWLCQNKPIAEDLVQETFLRAWRALDSLKEEKAAKSWLITILRRENARRFERKQFDLVDIDDYHLPDQKSATPEEDMEQHIIRQEIMNLAEEYREPLMLQVVGGFSGDEIGNMLSLNKNTVMTRLFRARNQLKEALESKKSKRSRQNG